MIIQAHLGIIVALDVMLGWKVSKAVGKIFHLSMIPQMILSEP
jgi:hypothetical protein